MTTCIALTGATGFVGRAISTALAQQGYRVRVRALVRSAQKAGLLNDSIETVPGDLDDTAALKDLVANADVVIHCAGAVRGATREDFDHVNVSGLSHLLDAVDGMATRPDFCLISSLAAREPKLSHYAASKAAGEALLASRYPDNKWLALRPAAVYGPGDRELLPLFKSMARGLAPIPGKPDARFSMVYVKDIASVIERWIEQRCATTGIFTLDDGTAGGYDWATVATTVAELCGHKKVRLLPVPTSVLNTIAGFNYGCARLFGYAPMLTPAKLRELRHPDWVCDSSGLQQTLGWAPAHRLREGLQNTPGWCPRIPD